MLQWLRSKLRRRSDVAAPPTPPLVIPKGVATPLVVDDPLAALLGDAVEVAPEVLAMEALIKRDVESGLISIPPMPSGAMRMLELVGKPDVDLNVLVTAMHWEPSVLVRILAVANTAAFRGRSSAVHDDVRGAIIALGMRMVGEIAAGIASRTLFQVESRLEYDLFPELWQAAHRETMVVAFGASALAHGRAMPRPDRVFLRAVLAGSARIVALRVIAARMIDGGLERPSNAAIEAAVDGVHRAVAVTAAARGTLPAVVTQTDDRIGALESAAVDLVATLMELRRSPGRLATTTRVQEQARLLGIQPNGLRVILRDCDDAESRVAAMIGARN